MSAAARPSDPRPVTRDLTRAAARPDLVVLAHGLSRTHRSLRKLERALAAAGYDTLNWDYQSRRYRVAELVDQFKAVLAGLDRRAGAVHFVGHSLGAILIRAALLEPPAFRVGRIVMLAPPNQGAAIVSRLLAVRPLLRLLGKPTAELGRGSPVLAGLGVPPFPTGVIAGSKRFHPLIPTSWLSLLLGIAPPYDGTLEVATTRLVGLRDFLVIDAGHSFIPDHREAIRQTLQFLQTGAFVHGRMTK